MKRTKYSGRLAFRISQKQQEALEDIADDQDLDVSEIMRRLIDEEITRHNDRVRKRLNRQSDN